MNMRKIISTILSASVLCTAVPAGAKDYRNGCTLMPVQYDETGVLPGSAYILSGVPAEQPELVINGEYETEITKQTDGTYLVVPKTELEYNSLYTFTLEGDVSASWTFQTAERFSVTNTLPGNDAYSVPVNSGIEITFSHEDFELDKVKESFSITPRITGAWEKHKNTAVFVPDKDMKTGTSYTVIIDGSMSRNDEALPQSYSFVFTTKDADADEAGEFSLVWADTYREVKTGEAPGISVSVRSNKDTLNTSTDVYNVSAKDALQVFTGDKAVPELYNPAMTPAMQKSQLFSDNYQGWCTLEVKLPDKLPAGFWLVKTMVEGKEAYTLLQSTDTAVNMFEDEDNYLLWVNSYADGMPIKGAKIKPGGKSIDITTDNDGLAYVTADEFSYIEIDAPDGRASYYPTDESSTSLNRYRSAVLTDRTLYKPEDTVHIWGTARGFDSGETLNNLTAELYTGRYYYGSYNRTPILTTGLTDNENSFEGVMELPNLSAGSYFISIKDGEQTVTSTYFSVEEYVKPAYKMSVAADKKAIFIGEEIGYTVNTAFFEGTAVPELDIKCRTDNNSFVPYTTDGKTDKNGNYTFSIKPQIINREYYGTEAYYGVGAYAKLPESGNIAASSSVRVFLNDIEINTESSYDNGITHIKLHSDRITTERLNNGTASGYNDYIDCADAGRKIKAEVYRITFEKKENGSYYDYITKKKYPLYDYEKKEKKVMDYTCITDNNGDASFDFTPTEIKRGYYELRFECRDSSERVYNNKAYLITSERTHVWYDYYSSDSYYVNTDKDKYDIGDTAEIKITRGMEPASDAILMIKDYNGIKDAQVSSGGEFKTVFNELPCATLEFYKFTPEEGYEYVSSTQLDYDSERSRISFEVSPDKESYAPGEECTLNIKAVDADGNPVKADINISLVDEALLALRDNDTDILSELYSWIYRCAVNVYTSHSSDRFGFPIAKYYGSGGACMEDASMKLESAEAENSADKGTATRSEFKDTAVFMTISSDDSGNGSATFKLPDNITSWRAAINGVTADLKAGNAECPIKVTMPQFISYNLSSSFISGDSPVIGVNLYGGSLTGGEEVVFKAECNESTAEAKGRAYERVDIPLGTLDTAGKQSVTVTAYIDGKAADSLKTEFEVFDTYNSTAKTVFYDSPYDEVRTEGGSNVRIVFTDKNRSTLLNDIFWLHGRIGDRLDQLLALNISRSILNEYYDFDYSENEIDYKKYQSVDGGMRLLQYGDSDIDATAKLTPYIKDKVDIYALKTYLEGHKNDIRALYALACLREPVMNELDCYAAADNLKARDYLYIALAYCELGEYGKADEIFGERIVPLTEGSTSGKRVRAGSDNDDIIEATALAAVTALYLERDDAESYYNYSIRSCTVDVVTNIEKLMYVSAAVKSLPEEKGKVSISLYGKQYDKEFCGSESRTVTVPAKKLNEFKVISASDSVRMISVSDEPMQVEEKENRDIKIERSYARLSDGEKTNEFTQNDIVKITLKLDFGKQAENGGYVITDYLPSGLKLISDNIRCENNSWRCAGMDGQRVKLYAYNGYTHDDDTITYYARVVSPGVYTADNAVLQSSKTTDLLAATGREKIVIR